MHHLNWWGIAVFLGANFIWGALGGLRDKSPVAPLDKGPGRRQRDGGQCILPNRPLLTSPQTGADHRLRKRIAAQP
jgi:hypothetical protein